MRRPGRRARLAATLAAALALAGCGAGETTEDATNALPVRIDRAVTAFLGQPQIPPPPVVETPPVLPGGRRPNLGDMPPRPVASSPEQRYTALAELAQQRADSEAESRRLGAQSPFTPEGQAALQGDGPLPPAPAIAIGPGRSLGTIVFATNSAALGEAQRQEVRAAAAQLGGAPGAGPGGAVRVIGYAGANLPPREAEGLARARAEAVAAELRAAGVAAARIRVQAPGSGSGRQAEIVVDL